MANVIGSATASLTLTPSPASAGSTYDVTATGSLTLTPTPHGPLTMSVHAVASLYVVPKSSRANWPSYTDDAGQRQTVVMEEAQESRHIEQSYRQLSYERIFYIHGTKHTNECVDIGPQPGDPDDLIPTMTVLKRRLETYARGGGYADIVKVTISYVQAETSQSDGGDAEATFTYDFTSDSDHVDVALAQTNYTPVGEAPAAGEDKLINFDGTDIEGIDIQSPVLEFSETHKFPATQSVGHASFNAALRRTIRDSVMSVNSVAFREYAIGEVLFIGACAEKRQNTWYVVFRFRARRNAAAIPFTIYNKDGAAEVVNAVKKGWQYLWVGVGTRTLTSGSTQKVRTAPVSVHVADIYQQIDFAVLGIGNQTLN